ncbi:transglutaminase domain-containing protein [Clostridium novyi]|uniref:Predicted transglutaminase/protease n=1 Tax=Clostridium novyi (strain NT) TaxID=386415 RepID=A0PZ23_CLONN|nr:transglutaminase domain-containing protein [Clostridium novyi]ABK61404.1 predicted transglutaminase/protease [Clostridium novyi NT]KEH86015.1 transglutaminase [Clostridium novyi A str. NCTC 538]KEH94040.1 transglutaminase [Clostridium novyi A str. GD211209]
MKHTKQLKTLSIATILGIALSGGLATNANAETRYSDYKNPNVAAATTNVKENDGVKSKEEFYDKVKSALENFETNVTIKIADYNNKDYNLNIFNKVILEHPEIDYGYKGVSGNIYGYYNTPEKTMNVNISYRQTKEVMQMEKQAVKAKVQKIIGEVIKPGMTDVQKELALHDYVVKNADYNVANYRSGVVTAEDHNAYGVLVKNTGVCESYAKAMYELLNAVGIECKYVTGHGNRGGHAWNMVKLDGQWYNLDATWDDPISDRNLGGNALVPISHKYFNVPDSIFNRDHARGEVARNYPSCTATKYSFDNLNVPEYTADGKLFVNFTTSDELHAEILKALENRDGSLCLKMKNVNIGLNDLMRRIQIIAQHNNIYGFGMNVSSSGSYIRVNFNWL